MKTNKLRPLFIFSIASIVAGFCNALVAAENVEELLSNYQLGAFSNQSLNKNEQENTKEKTLNQHANSQDVFQQKNRKGLVLPGETDVRNLLPRSEEGLAPPFGSNIFAGGYESERVDGLNENYLIAAGDKISIWLWGTVNFSDLVTVDNQGNIFLPNIGPVKVAGVKASEVNEFVTDKIRTVYKDNVKIYVNLMTATPISLFVTGAAIRPGQYAGMPSDSVLYYLKRAGGIDSERGSYRSVKIIRDGDLVEEIDLYDFVRKGILKNINFKDNDVIFVSPQQSIVNVSGGVKNPFRFEFSEDVISGKEIMEVVRPLSKTSHVLVSGNRTDGPFSVYLSTKDFLTFEVKDGDKLFFNDDLHAQVFDIEIVGSYLGPSFFTVSKSTKLHDLLNHIQVEPDLANIDSIYLLRKSVALEQKALLDRSLDRLERSIYVSPASSTGEAQIRTQEAKLISEFIARARKVKPLGKVIVADGGNIANVALEQGDKIVIPAKTDLVQVAGEVLMPQAVVYNSNASIEDYIAWAGGYTNRANFTDIIVVHANGLTEFVKAGSDGSWISSSSRSKLSPGDKVVVLPRVEAKTMQTVKDITQILYQLAVAANVAN